MLKVTQGDVAVFKLTAVQAGLPLNLTGATFSTQIRGPNGAVVSFGNSKHTANPDQSANTGKFNLSLSATDTASLALGSDREVITLITIGGNPVYFRGVGILTVLPNVPEQ